MSFGVTPATVQARRLRNQQQVRADALQLAIDEAVADLRMHLRSMGVDPDGITPSTFPDDYIWCQRAVTYGAAAYYLGNVAGQDELAGVEGRFFDTLLRQVKDDPWRLAAYQAGATSRDSARGPSQVSPADTARARARMLDPSDRGRWRQ